MTASLLLNFKRSQKMLGERVISHVQRDWSGPKVLRVTDRVTGAERFVELNKKVFHENMGAIVVSNNITQGRYDIVVSDKPMTDTVRQKNLENIFSAIQKAPPEAIAPLLNLAFELSDFPNKAQLLHQLRAVLGVEPIDPLLTTAEADAKAAQKQQAIEKQQQAEAQMQMAERQAVVDLNNARVQEIMAKIQEVMANIQAKPAELALDQTRITAEAAKDRSEAWIQGFKVMQDLHKQKQMSKQTDAKIELDKQKLEQDKKKGKEAAKK